MTKQHWWELDSMQLHLVAMIFMLFDHTWATLLPSQEWLTCLGRIAFPIFAFMIVEGYYHTHNVKKYMLRLLAFALVSEVPFNLMVNGSIFYPYHQNVMWTFLLALGCIFIIEKIKVKGKLWITILVAVGITLLGTVLGFALFVDYFGTGILTVLMFYYLHERKWWCYLGQLVFMYILNVQMLGGYYYNVNIFNMHFELIQQGFAMLSLIFIWLYKGAQGYHSKPFQYFCYAFYPLHILVLYALGHVL